ncbi:Tetratricopeptide repeat protein 1 [Fasciola hepatica]|uniref:Tetratricopeptide repeat protein 1 n=1 Tax=Fasciola hepatica TaxID=6192 RepID=A0A4E0R0B5_FASHE|nr:Tetratricopeptide repeat protein 1 [Fasciola hepatica]
MVFYYFSSYCRTMDSDSDSFCDAQENFSDVSPVNQNRTDQKATDSSNGQPPTVPATPEFEEFQPAVSDESDGEPAAHKNSDSETVRKEEEALLDSNELEERRVSAQDIKEKGNELFKEANFSEALQKYTEALDLCPLKFPIDRSVMFSNRAACHAKLDAPESALADCDSALTLQPNYLKCLMRRAALREEKERLSDALEDYQCILKLDPSNEKARWACATLPDRIKDQQEKLKEQMIDQLKQLGNIVLKPFGLSTENFKVQKNPDSEGYSINFVR